MELLYHFPLYGIIILYYMELLYYFPLYGRNFFKKLKWKIIKILPNWRKKIFQHLQSPRSTWLICCQTTFAVHGIPFKLVFSVLHTIPFKLPNIQQPLTLTACDFNILPETDFGGDLFVWYRNLEKEQNNQEHPIWSFEWNVLKVTSSTWKCWHIGPARKKKKM